MHPGCTIEQVYLYREAIDFRKAIDGLSVLVEQELGLSPLPAPCTSSPIARATRSKHCTGTATAFVFGKSVWRRTNSPGQRTARTPPKPSAYRNSAGCSKALICGEINLIKPSILRLFHRRICQNTACLLTPWKPPLFLWRSCFRRFRNRPFCPSILKLSTRPSKR